MKFQVDSRDRAMKECRYRSSYLDVRVNKEVSMAAVAPPLAMILIIALILYLAWWNAYKRK
jgi:hypothetical protein